MMRRPRPGYRCALFVLLAMSAGWVACETPYRAPIQISPEPGPVDESTLIPYRTLVESDFKAAQLPSEETPENVEAVTVANIRVPPFHVRLFRRTNADSSFLEAVPDSFRFEARMSQAASWLNPRHKGTILHILAHEQVHFAIWELSARQANARIDEIRARIRSTARVDSVALRLASRRFDQELERVRKEALDRNVDFDKDTRNGQRFYRNDLWVERIKKEIEETAAAASASTR
jgi:hypothetical protein